MKQSKININERFTLIVVKWLELYFIQSGLLHYSERLIKKFYRILRTRGKVEAIRFSKETREALLLWLNTISSFDKKVRSSSKVALPKDLRFLKHLTRLEHPHMRLILSALYVSRGLELPVTINTTSITQEPTFYSSIIDFTKYVGDFWYALGIRHEHDVPKCVYWRKFHLTTKTGPNGHALWSAIADLSVLPDDLIEAIKVVGGKRLTFRIELMRKYLYLFVPYFGVKGTRFRKVSAIPAPEGKTREIAILDYWSQTSLLGLHRYLFKQLQKIPQDCTFAQGSFQQKLTKFKDNGHLYYSVDLTTATDRFPISLIWLLLRARFGESYVNSWRTIMVGFPFDTPKGSIRYAVGNPMGAYSSWNSFAIAHHFVMYCCCRELGIDWGDAPYVLLGDDIVIKHNKLANKYLDVMTSLGLTFSLKKSHISPHMFEFAKRIFHNETEITPFPISALLQSRRSPSQVLNTIESETLKGWISPLGTPTVSSELYKVGGFNATYVAKKRRQFYIAHQIMMGIRGCITAADSVKGILVEYYPDQVKILQSIRMPQSGVDRICEYWYIAMFRQSLVSSVSPKPGDKPLGLIAEKLVMLITGRDDTMIDAFDLIQALPVLQVHGQVEETYMKVVKGGDEQLRLCLKGDWKFVLKALTIPVSDEIYYCRNQDIMVHASFTLSKILQSMISNFKSIKDIGSLSRPRFGNS